MGITANDLAKACGVSRGTIDRALNNRPGINPETKEKILNTAKELEYKPDFLAKSLVTGKTMTIGVVVFDVYTRFFGRLVTSIETKAKEVGYFTYLTLTNKNCNEEKKCIEHLIERKVDGIILCPINKGPDFDKFLDSLHVPVVTILNKVNNDIEYIGINDESAVSEVVSYLKNGFHENILYVSAPRSSKSDVNMYAVERRLQGFIDGCNTSDIVINEKNVIEDVDYIKIVLERMVGDNPPSAIICSNDIYALELMKALKHKGFKIPEDVSLIGFDNIDELDYVEPGLTTISMPIDQIGTQAINALLNIIDGEVQPLEFILKHKLIVRDSVGLYDKRKI
ncbi:MAG TPA: LacI family DNA-binding transcriptional regulator [Clostridiaceae bacterium]